jgi:hypothetical protein
VLYGHPLKVLAGEWWTFESSEQNAPSLDAAATRKLASQISGQVITPEHMNRHAWFSTAHSIGIRR